MESIVHIGLNIIQDIPIKNIWKPQIIITKQYSVYYILVLLLHIIPALFLNGIMKLIGARPM